MDHLISLYIDNELSLDEKIIFVRQTSDSTGYANEAISLLEQKKQLAATLNRPAPAAEVPVRSGQLLHFSMQSLGWAVAACILLVFTFSTTYDPGEQHLVTTVEQPSSLHRFVIQQAGSEQVEITGTFTDWQRIPLMQAGTKGYWEVSLAVPAGEHRYSFIVNGSRILADPTVSTSEHDDFGAANSILRVET